MANLVELGIACDGSYLDCVGSDGILQSLVLEMRSPLNSELSISTCRSRDLRLIVSPLWLAIRLKKADRECIAFAILEKRNFKVLFYGHLMDSNEATHCEP